MQRFLAATAVLISVGMVAQVAHAEQATMTLPAAVPSVEAPPEAPPSVTATESVLPTTLARAINLPAQQKMPESFGAPRQLVLGGSSSFNVHGFHQRITTRSDAGVVTATANALSLDLEPWVGVFVCRHFLVGGILPISYARGGNVWFANVGVGPLFAWHIPVGTHFALLPRTAIAYQFARARRIGSDVAAATSDSHAVYVNVRVDAVAHLTHHLSVVAGPYASWSVLNRVNKAKAPWETYYGLQVGLLGWF